MQKDSWNGKSLREMFRTGTQLLSNNSETINALNVFPVPDGDTGTNMLLTMQSAMTEANQYPDNDAAAVAHAMAHGALMGARGNSGVILSQILKGMAKGLEGKQSFAARDMSEALAQASTMAYQAVSRPAEGTILTVIREASMAGQHAASIEPDNLRNIIKAVVHEAKQSVDRTPSLLPVLRETGVVDAGGQGLRIILEGLLLYLEGKEPVMDHPVQGLQPATTPLPHPQKEPEYGYCTEFLIEGNDLDLEAMRSKLNETGEHVLVVGDESTARIHVHTLDPGTILSYATLLGTLHRIKIDNMEDQHEEFIASYTEELPLQSDRIGSVAVASGDGLVKVLKSLGATHIVHGGITMNPSVQDLLQAVESLPTDRVVILPNDPDILPAAHQVNQLTDKTVAVVPSRTIVQGVVALVAFNEGNDLYTNVNAMTESIATVRTGQIANATRSMQYNELQVTEGQIVGFVEEELSVAEDTIEAALFKLLAMMDLEKAEILTVYYGNEVQQYQAEVMFQSVHRQYPDVEIEIIFGGQPHYHYLISVE